MDKTENVVKLSGFKGRLSDVSPIDKMMLFGGRAYGAPHRWSDFDLIVVNKKFKGVKFCKLEI